VATGSAGRRLAFPSARVPAAGKSRRSAGAGVRDPYNACSVNYDAIDRDQLLTSTEVGNLLQVNPSSVKKWVNEGHIIAFRTPGGHRRIRAADLVQFLDEHKIPVPRALQEAGRRRVLVVENDVTQLKAIGRAFKRYGDRVDLMLADNGIDALLRIGAARPHLVVLDASMPGLDGVEVCRRLKANPETSEIVVVLSSAYVTANLEESARKAGARQAVRKPIDVPALLEEMGVRLAGMA
jgi:excisionase family DNA binding protein